jgi:hypothetical protein
MVKDGNTIVIGGLFREDSSTGRSQVPFLGNIPIAGQLFRRQRDRTTREEVIILLTPHIIQDEDAYTKESMKAMGDAQRMRVGIRKGMMPWGRERMAELSYEWAQKELAKPNPDQGKVLWHLNVATNLNPHFMEAIKLKEKISGAQLYGVDNSTIRDFLRDRVMASEPDRAGGSAPQTPPEKKSVIPPAQSPVSSMPMSNTPMDEAIPNVKVD